MTPLEVMFVIAATQSVDIAQDAMWTLVLPFSNYNLKILLFLN